MRSRSKQIPVLHLKTLKLIVLDDSHPRGVRELIVATPQSFNAHRLSAIKDANLILVLHKGHIEERGTHSELLERQGRYH